VPGLPHLQPAAPKLAPPLPTPVKPAATPPAPAAVPAATLAPAPAPPLLAEHISPLAEAALLQPACKEARQQAAAALQLLHPARAELLPVLQRLLPRACSAGKAAKQYFTLLEDCLEVPNSAAAGAAQDAQHRSIRSGGGGAVAKAKHAPQPALAAPAPPAARQAALEGVGSELRTLTQRLLTQQEVEAAGLVNAGPQGFTLGWLIQLLQSSLGLGLAADGNPQATGREGSTGAAAVAATGGGLPPPHEQQALLRQVLWAAAALDALSVGRTAATKAAARQLEGLLKDLWADCGTAAGAAEAGRGAAGADAMYAPRWQVARAAVELLESLQVAPGSGEDASGCGAGGAGWLQHMAPPLLSRLVGCVCPERAAPVYVLQLIKAASQTDVSVGN
jgi:hypothetical protein